MLDLVQVTDPEMQVDKAKKANGHGKSENHEESCPWSPQTLRKLHWISSAERSYSAVWAGCMQSARPKYGNEIRNYHKIAVFEFVNLFG